MRHLPNALLVGVVFGFLLAVAPGCGKGKKCGPDTCKTCCDAKGTCVASASTATCGTGGQACTACGTGQSCELGLCKSPGGDGGNTTCTSGCLNNGVCENGLLDSSCGNNGATCTVCQGLAHCQAATNGGKCTSADAGEAKLGIACGQDSDCAPIPSAVCKKTTSLGNGTYQDGYCTKTCATNNDCPGNDTCFNSYADVTGEETGLCLAPCTANFDAGTSDCRVGYACYQLNTGDNGCWIDSAHFSAVDGGWKVGGPCAQTADCSPPSSGECIPATLDGGPSGYTDGMCTASPCVNNPGVCGQAGICVQYTAGNQTESLCERGCSTPGAGPGDADGGCRTGYTCRSLFTVGSDGGLQRLNVGHCAPRCDATGVACPTDYSCNSNGYCCLDGGCLD